MGSKGRIAGGVGIYNEKYHRFPSKIIASDSLWHYGVHGNGATFCVQTEIDTTHHPALNFLECLQFCEMRIFKIHGAAL
jgi:hypothetical protein